MKTSLLIIIALSLQGCLKAEVKSPDSLVADTVHASTKNTCLSKVKDVAIASIGTDKFDIRETKNGNSDSQTYIECKIVVASQK